MRITKAPVPVLSALLAATLAVPARAEAAGSSSELLSLINSLRASRGVGALTLDSSLSAKAQAWAEHMAAVQKLSHQPLSGTGIAAENVGMGSSVSVIFKTFSASSGHYANMVGPSYGRIGIGIAVAGNGMTYTANEFATGGGSAPSRPASKPPAQTSPPAHVERRETTTTHASRSRITTTTEAPPPPPTTAPPVPPVDAGASGDSADEFSVAMSDEANTLDVPAPYAPRIAACIRTLRLLGVGQVTVRFDETSSLGAPSPLTTSR